MKLYRAVCDCPVARRNFCRRHGHGLDHARVRQEKMSSGLVHHSIADDHRTLKNAIANSPSVSAPYNNPGLVDLHNLDSLFNGDELTQNEAICFPAEDQATSIRFPMTHENNFLEQLPAALVGGEESTPIGRKGHSNAPETSVSSLLSGLEMPMSAVMMEATTIGIDYSTIFDT